MYKVIKKFVDLQDNNFKYDVGDVYPRDGVSALPSRVKELASNKNKLGTPLIEEIMETDDETSEVDVKKPRKRNE